LDFTVLSLAQLRQWTGGQSIVASAEMLRASAMQDAENDTEFHSSDVSLAPKLDSEVVCGSNTWTQTRPVDSLWRISGAGLAALLISEASRGASKSYKLSAVCALASMPWRLLTHGPSRPLDSTFPQALESQLHLFMISIGVPPFAALACGESGGQPAIKIQKLVPTVPRRSGLSKTSSVFGNRYEMTRGAGASVLVRNVTTSPASVLAVHSRAADNSKTMIESTDTEEIDMDVLSDADAGADTNADADVDADVEVEELRDQQELEDSVDQNSKGNIDNSDINVEASESLSANVNPVPLSSPDPVFRVKLVETLAQAWTLRFHELPPQTQLLNGSQCPSYRMALTSWVQAVLKGGELWALRHAGVRLLRSMVRVTCTFTCEFFSDEEMEWTAACIQSIEIGCSDAKSKVRVQSLGVLASILESPAWDRVLGRDSIAARVRAIVEAAQAVESRSNVVAQPEERHALASVKVAYGEQKKRLGTGTQRF